MKFKKIFILLPLIIGAIVIAIQAAYWKGKMEGFNDARDIMRRVLK